MPMSENTAAMAFIAAVLFDGQENMRSLDKIKVIDG